MFIYSFKKGLQRGVWINAILRAGAGKARKGPSNCLYLSAFGFEKR